MKQLTCNQCHREMDVFWFFDNAEDRLRLFACARPECPNYGLLQIPAEQMPNEKK